MNATLIPSETAIWGRILRPETCDMPKDVAEFFLALHFPQQDLERMHMLTMKNQEGELSADEREELSKYREVGLQLDMLKSRARLSLICVANAS